MNTRTILGLLASFCPLSGGSLAQSTLPPSLARADRAPIGGVETEIRNVHYHAVGAVIQIRHLRGLLQPTAVAKPPWFEDRSSFTIAVDTGEMVIDTASLSRLLTNHVFRYPGSPLKKLAVSIEDGNLKQKGKLHHLPFTIRATVSTTDDGRIRIHPHSVKVIGISVKGLMGLFGIELENLIKVDGGRGVEVDGNDIVLAASALLPPPIIRGRLTSVTLQPGAVVTTFGRSSRSEPPPRLLGDSSETNYLRFRGGVLRFGKLTMSDASLDIVDADPKDPFDFDIVSFNEQLVAGSSKNRSDFGLVTTIPDFNDLPARRPKPSSARR